MCSGEHNCRSLLRVSSSSNTTLLNELAGGWLHRASGLLLLPAPFIRVFGRWSGQAATGWWRQGRRDQRRAAAAERLSGCGGSRGAGGVSPVPLEASRKRPWTITCCWNDICSCWDACAS